MISVPSPFTHAASIAAFSYIMDNILDNDNVMNALEESGIEDIFSFLMLKDNAVENLTYCDPDPNVTTLYRLKMGEIGLIKTPRYPTE
jgi:hypothetical protein